MADKKPSPSDLYMQEFLKGIQTGRIGSDPSEASPLATAALESDQLRKLAQDQIDAGQRDLGDHLQDAGAGLLGTLDAIGNTILLGVAAGGDALGNLTGTNPGWDATQEILEDLNEGHQFTTSLQSEKSDAFDRISAYRQERAIREANLVSQMLTGEDAPWLAQQAAAFKAAGGAYLDNPDQILTEGIAQLPYLATGGLAKGVVEGTTLANPLIGLLSRRMSVESATKLVEMGLVGVAQGTIEGADAAGAAYDRVMQSTDTFGPGQEAEREIAALKAAGKAFGIAGATSAITGTLASKYELAPFGSKATGVLGRTTDNLVKALQEGVQETIESGTSQFASNYAGNTELKGKDLVALEEGVGSAAGTGLVVGMGSTVVTNPRAVVDAAASPLALAGKAVGLVGSQAVAKERREDMAAAQATADAITANSVTPAMTAALNEGVTTDTPAEDVAYPPEIDTRSQVGLFATGMEYLRGKNMDSEDAVTAFHVLGAVLSAANNIRNLREGAKTDAANESLAPEDREKAKTALTKLDAIINNDQLDKWVAQLPMEDIEEELEDLRQNPENFGAVIAHLAAMNPLKMTDKVLDVAMEAKSLPKEQRESLELAKELKAAEAELKVKGKPDSAAVTQSMMQTGFPGSTENDSVAGYISKITTAMGQSDTKTAQHWFNRLLKFSKYEQQRAADYEAARDQMFADPNSAAVKVAGYGSFDPDTGKFDKNRTPVVNKTEGSLEMVKAVRSDADTIAKMTNLIQQRTGLQDLSAATPVATSETAPAAVAEPTATETPAKAEKPAAKPETKPAATPAPVVEENEFQNMSDEEIAAEADSLKAAIGRRRNNDTGKAIDQDVRYDNLIREMGRRHVEGTKAAPAKAVDKPVDQKHAVVEEAPAAEVVADPAPVEIVEEEATVEVVAEPSRNHFTDLQPSYPVAEGATGAERNDATNHLAQSFTSSDQPGLRSKGEALTNLDALKEAVNVNEEDVPALEALFNTKNKLLNRLQQLVGHGGAAKAKHMLNGGNLWKKVKYHFLYATKWSDKGVRFQDEIAQVMAWTGVQHMMDMINPVSWSNDLIQQLQQTYGPEIREKLADGWVPMKDQIEQLARKLQTNLELKADGKVSVEYTEGTMLALAGRIMESMITTQNYNGVVQHETIMTQAVGDNPALPVQWVRMSVDKTNGMLYDAARILEDFLPERASTNAAHIGTAPTNVNPFYRGSQQKIGKEQKAALAKRNKVAHKLSPLMHNMMMAVPKGDLRLRLFGMDLAVKDFPSDKKELSLSQIARKGAANTLFADLTVIGQHITKLMAHAAGLEDGDIYSIPSFFEYEQVTNGRAMTKGTSPQSSKWYRELFAIAQYQVDPTTKPRGFLMAVAQGFGVKMDIQKIDASLTELEVKLKHPDMQRALEAAARLGDKNDYSNNQTLLEADLSAIEKLAVPKSEGGMGIELSPHAMSALMHMAQYQKGQPFTSSLMYEIDGKTDGPINLMMLMGLTGSAMDMEAMLGLGGLFFDQDGSSIAVQDMTEQLKSWNGGKKDLYEIITGKATELTPATFDRVLKAVVDKAPDKYKESTKKQATALMKATLHLVQLAGLSKGDVMNLAMEYERAFSKKSTQAAGYLQGGLSVSNDLLSTIMEAVSARMDAGTLEEIDKQAINTFFRYALGETKVDGVYFNHNPKAYRDKDGNPFVWEGKPLSHAQESTARNTINTFVGGALFNGLVQTIGLQRENMMSAVTIMQARIEYADHVLRTRYIAKQNELVEKGELHPGQALSKADEQAIVKDVWAKLVPHPVLRNTGGLPVGSLGRFNGNPILGSTKLDGSRRIETRYFESGAGQTFSHFSGLTEAMFENPGVSFAALSIMAAGDGSMMTGLFSKTMENVLDMYDGLYMSPEIIDQMGEALNQEVKANWEHDFIGAILTSLQQTEDQGFRDWAEAQETDEGSRLDTVREAELRLQQQRERQIATMRDINSRTHYVSHMAGHGQPAKFDNKPLNSATVGTSQVDPLLDLALDQHGEVNNGIRTLSKSDVINLLDQHTFENPVLSGLWKVLRPLIGDNLRLHVSADWQAMADFYKQNEREEMGPDATGTAFRDNIYIRAITSETFLHELLHYTTKSLVATYFRSPSQLTAQQRAAMKNLEDLMMDFMSIRWGNATDLSSSERLWTQHTQSVVYGYLQQGNTYAAMEEFLAYGLTNYHVQTTLGKTTARTPLLASIFAAVKKLFGFPAGVKTDSMLGVMFSNFTAATEQAKDITYPIAPEEALQAINPELARSFGPVLAKLVDLAAVQDVMNESMGKATTAQAHYASRKPMRDRLDEINRVARTRMQELADSNLFPTMTNEQQSAGEYLQALFAAGLQFKASENALLARVVDAVRKEGEKAWRTNDDPADQADIDLAKARFKFFFENTTSDHDVSASILAMALVNPEFAEHLNRIVLPREGIDKSSLNNWLDSSVKTLYDMTDTGLALKKGSTLSDALEVAALRMRKSLVQSAKRQETKPGPYRRLTNKLSEGVQFIGEKAGKTAEARMKLKANKDWISSSLMAVAGMTNETYADKLANLVLSLSNQIEGANPAREVVQEMTGTTTDNFKLIQLKGIAARMVSAIRQSFREQVPVTVKSWFKDLTPEQDALLHTVIGKMAVYDLSQDLKDRMEEILTDPKAAIDDASLLLTAKGGKGALMVRYAKRLGDLMANKGNAALYRNTQAIAGLAVDGGNAPALTAREMEALENLSTLQALSHLTPMQRRQVLALYRENTEGFWKTAALIHAFKTFDTQRAGQNTATMNFQKGWIPVESDARKKLKLFQKVDVRKAERLGWVQVGEFADDPNLVYMATTVGRTPTLSGGAIHAVDFHMNGIHFHSGLPTDPSIQTIITHPKTMAEIQARVLKGEAVPYTALYDAAGDVVGFQRALDPAMLDRHTKSVGRISDAAGIWLGRLHEERVAHGQNQAAANLLRETWDQGKADKRENEFVNIRQPVDRRDPNAKQDKVLLNIWNTLPYHTKVQLENAFADGTKNPPIWIRRDQLNDAIGYHKAGVGNFFTGDNRYEKAVNANVAALTRQMLGKNAYKYLTTAEDGWQALVGSAKDTIIVKSLTVLLNNLASNQIQLFMITGNPVWNLRVQSQKHKELVSYLGYQQRVARLTAEGLATHDPKVRARIDTEQAFLKNEMRKLSIYPLIEAGEMPTIKGEGLSETEEFSLAGDITNWIEGQMGRLPGPAKTLLNNLVISKETSLYKGLDRGVQYGDFVAKAAMYEWLMTQDKQAKIDAFKLVASDPTKKMTMAEALHQVALKEINDEFVNYARLPGRWRTYGEDMGLLWFYNYKLRMLKMGFRRIRKNPAAFLIGAQVGSMLGVSTLLDTLPGNASFSYSTGIDPLFSAHETIMWNQMF